MESLNGDKDPRLYYYSSKPQQVGKDEMDNRQNQTKNCE
jgi:hypothetical protein